MNIAKKLDLWQQKKLITPEQTKAIIDFERKSSRPVLTYYLLALGLFCIGLGIISLISANWQLIPAAVKFFFDFVLLIAVCWGIYYANAQNKNTLFEGLTLLYALLILASIGLIAQVYQLQPDGYLAYFIWAVLVFPMVVYTSKIILPLVWLPVITTSGIDLLNNIPLFARMMRILENSFPFAISISGVLVLSFIYRFLAVHFRTRLASLISAMKFWLVFDIAVMVIIMDFMVGMFGTSAGSYVFRLFNPGNNVSIMVISILVVSTVGFGYFSYKHNYSRLLTCVIAILLGFSMLYIVLPDSGLILNIWGFLLSMSVLCCLVAYALLKNRRRLLNLATALMALRIFIVYLQVFGTLLATSFGLIISGLVFLTILYVWRRLNLDNLIIIKEGKNA